MRNIQRKIASSLLGISLFFFISACEAPSSDNTAALAALAIDIPPTATKSEFLVRYAEMAYESYNQAVLDAISLKAAITTFTATRNLANFNAVKDAWVVARSSYLVTEGFRFSNGPIDSDPGFCGGNPAASYGGTDECEGALNAWPLDEDTIENYITNNASITFAGIYGANGDSGLASGSEGDPDKVVMTGYHPIEYLLWGKDDFNSGDNTVAGQRDFSYFDDATFGARRRTFLEVAADGIIGHLTQIRDEWDPSQTSGTYRTDVFLVSANVDTILEGILQGIGAFIAGEWGGERLTGAISGTQEEEHSCFSDTTKADFYYDAQSVTNIWTGNFSIVKNVNVSTGPGLSNLLSSKSQGSVLSELLESRDSFCINLADTETADPNYRTSCPSNSLTRRFDQVIDPSDSQNQRLQDIQFLIGERLKRDFVNAANILGVSVAP